RTEMEPLDAVDLDRLAADLGELEQQALAQLARDGLTGDDALVERSADCRYVGQGYELRVPLPAGPLDEGWRDRARETFHAYHERRYFRRYEDAQIQLVNVHVTGVGALPELELTRLEPAGQ